VIEIDSTQGMPSGIKIDALRIAFCSLARKALELKASVHLPRIGAGTPNFNW
jgi:hypothetical protein